METRILETSSPALFRDYLKVLNTMAEEVDLVFDHDGISTLFMDPSHVAMVDFHLPPEHFDRYDIEEPFTVGLNLETALKALNKITKRDSFLTLEYGYETQESEETRTQIKKNERITLELKSDIKRRKTFQTLEPMGYEVPTPKINFKSTTRIILDVIKRICDDFKGHAHITIETTDQGITFSVNNDEMRETTPIDQRNGNILDHHVEEDTKATYTLSYLSDLVRSMSKISEVTKLEFSEDMPIKLDVEIPQGHLIYYQAPCIGI